MSNFTKICSYSIKCNNLINILKLNKTSKQKGFSIKLKPFCDEDNII